MVTVETYTLSVVLSVLTMICWGSWPVTQKLVTPTWRFELYYWDYVLGIVAITLIFGLTMGTFGKAGNTFIVDIQQAESQHLFSAALGGAIFNAANILFVAAITFAGMAIAFSIGAGFGLVLGVTINYLAIPDGSPYHLFGGVLFIVLAICLSAISNHRVSPNNLVSAKGILLALMAGLLFGFFYRFIASAMYTDFQTPEIGKLGPYAATFCFGIGALLSNFVFNTILMRKPLRGKPVSFSAYFRGRSRDHLYGVLGGAIWGTGLVLSIISAGNLGFAVSFGLGQGNALIAAIWGVFIWKEFSKAPRGTNRLLYWMFICYIIGLGLIVYAKS